MIAIELKSHFSFFISTTGRCDCFSLIAVLELIVFRLLFMNHGTVLSGLLWTRMMNVQFLVQSCRECLAYVAPLIGNQLLKELFYFDISRFHFFRML